MNFGEATGLEEEAALGNEAVLDRPECCDFAAADGAGLLPGKTVNAAIATAKAAPQAIRTVVRVRRRDRRMVLVGPVPGCPARCCPVPRWPGAGWPGAGW